MIAGLLKGNSKLPLPQERSGINPASAGLVGARTSREHEQKEERRQSMRLHPRDCTPLAVVIIVPAMITAGLIIAQMLR